MSKEVKVDIRSIKELRKNTNLIGNSIAVYSTEEIAKLARERIFAGSPVGKRTGVTQEAYQARFYKKAGTFATGFRAKPIIEGTRGREGKDKKGRFLGYLGVLRKMYNIKRLVEGFNIIGIVNKKKKNVVNYYVRKAKAKAKAKTKTK